MLQALPFPIRTECPPGACVCNRELVSDPEGDARILKLTREQEKILLARIEGIDNFDKLKRIEQLMYEQLGITLTITPSIHEVRSARGLAIKVAEQPGLCRKTRQAIPTAIRRCLDQHPHIVYAILNAHDLLGKA